MPHKRSRRNGIEDDRNLAGFYLACAKTLKRPLRRAPPDFFGRIELITMTRNGKPMTPAASRHWIPLWEMQRCTRR